MFLLTASTGCDYWQAVPVPTSDSSPPIAASRILEIGGSGYDDIDWGPGPGNSITVYDPSRKFIALGATWDPEGAFRVVMDPEVVRVCSQGSVSANQTFNRPLIEYVAPAPTNGTVMTGVHTGDVVDPSTWALSCPGSTTLESITYSWTVHSENYFGGVASHGPISIRYEF